jgi:hypothetical protein
MAVLRGGCSVDFDETGAGDKLGCRTDKSNVDFDLFHPRISVGKEVGDILAETMLEFFSRLEDLCIPIAPHDFGTFEENGMGQSISQLRFIKVEGGSFVIISKVTGRQVVA